MKNITAPVTLSVYNYGGVEYTALSRVSLVGSACAGCCFHVVNGWDMEYCAKPLSFNHPDRCITDGVIYKEKQ